MYDLNRCKKCGAEEGIRLTEALSEAFQDHLEEETRDMLSNSYVVLCGHCRAMTQIHETKEDAVKDWNAVFYKIAENITIGGTTDE